MPHLTTHPFHLQRHLLRGSALASHAAASSAGYEFRREEKLSIRVIILFLPLTDKDKTKSFVVAVAVVMVIVLFCFVFRQGLQYPGLDSDTAEDILALPSVSSFWALGSRACATVLVWA